MAQWPATLDVRDLTREGWEPVPFREIVLKVHGRCDLACDYCYMYTMADQSWRSQPRRMQPEIIDAAASRIGEHARAHHLQRVKLVLHGGEPLLAGPDSITHAVRAVRAAVGPATRVDTTVQTNAVRLSTGYLDLFAELGVVVGVSMDGDATAHDRHRRHPSGRGSHAEVRAALQRLASHPCRANIFGGLLCTIDTRNDSVSTYEALLEFRPPMIDFLLPHGNWLTPPRGRSQGVPGTPYADWLIEVFNRWYGAPHRETQVRLFSELMRALLGGQPRTEAIGLAPSAVVVIETDGGIEQSDSLKSAYPGATLTGLNVIRNSLDDALMHPAVAARQLGLRALCDSCQACSIVRVCGGGHFAHRYGPRNGFRNPSVYCPDLLRLIGHVRCVMAADIRLLAADRA
jgi:uncharacterized protein